VKMELIDHITCMAEAALTNQKKKKLDLQALLSKTQVPLNIEKCKENRYLATQVKSVKSHRQIL
jgi:hypothetical protein